ncbi:hypothetical protein GobsT_07700 [Gemmata obscuriglobus]|uniref:Uncharacterized protein n=1 Tax=Gemmata obscuriglobus TaxID=114 RepID=A0A2Z3HAK9_9BACT|nr:hypothetical protein [Gemmata obscuriglobus]AWM40696.1 hypothetical protein C1280_29400 [Gemmata obscuriglobus]QEG26035.1 hypothetical protein GobsT_07700 [Gemmata obscuriglobus]VTS00388.1 unnamed protein product [Gemmata obscuriglobus UQM 2246]
MAGCGNAGRDPGARLLPLIARVIDLGRGPPGLVQWVTARLGCGLGARELAHRLAGELARPGAGAADTLPAAPHQHTRGDLRKSRTTEPL